MLKMIAYFFILLNSFQADVVYCYGGPVLDLEVRVSAVGHMAGGGQNVLQSEDDLKRTNAHGQVAFTLNVPLNTQRIVVTVSKGRTWVNHESRKMMFQIVKISESSCYCCLWLSFFFTNEPFYRRTTLL